MDRPTIGNLVAARARGLRALGREITARALGSVDGPSAALVGYPSEVTRRGIVDTAVTLPMQHLRHFPQTETDAAGSEYLVETFAPAAAERTRWNVWTRSGGNWTVTGDLGPPARVDATLTVGTVAADAGPPMPENGVETSRFVARDGRYWRWDGSAWIRLGDLTASGAPKIHTGDGAPVDSELTTPANNDLYVESFRLAAAEQTIALAARTVEYWDIAARLPCTSEVLEDVARARSFVDGRLTAAALLLADQRVGQRLRDMSGVTEITGQAATSGNLVATGVAKAISAVEDDGRARATVCFVRSAVLDSWADDPNVQRHARLRYVDAMPTYRGIPVQRSDQLSAARWAVAVAAPVHTEVLFHPSARVDFTDSHADEFQRLVLQARVWLRALLAVYRSTAVCRITT